MEAPAALFIVRLVKVVPKVPPIFCAELPLKVTVEAPDDVYAEVETLLYQLPATA